MMYTATPGKPAISSFSSVPTICPDLLSRIAMVGPNRPTSRRRTYGPPISGTNCRRASTSATSAAFRFEIASSVTQTPVMVAGASIRPASPTSERQPRIAPGPPGIEVLAQQAIDGDVKAPSSDRLMLLHHAFVPEPGHLIQLAIARGFVEQRKLDVDPLQGIRPEQMSREQRERHRGGARLQEHGQQIRVQADQVGQSGGHGTNALAALLGHHEHRPGLLLQLLQEDHGLLLRCRQVDQQAIRSDLIEI